MASAVYPNFLVNVTNAAVPMVSGEIKALLFDSADGAYDNTDNDVADLTALGIAAVRSGALQSKTFTAAANLFTFDAANITITAVTLGDSCERAIIYYDPGTGDANCPLIADLELAVAITPNGGDITLSWTASGIFTVTCTPA